MKPLAKFALVSELDGTVETYYKQGNQKIRVGIKRPIDHAYLRQTIMDANTRKNYTIRLKLNCTSVLQEVQIKEHNIPANEEFTPQEKDAVEFRNGILYVYNETVLEYLKINPQFQDSKNTSNHPDGNRKKYFLIDEVGDAKNLNAETKLRVKCANKIFELDEDSARKMLIRINGSFFETPTGDGALEEMQNKLMQFLDDTDEDGMNRILEDDIESVNEIVILVGELEAKDILSFNRKTDYVVLQKNGRDIDIRKITSKMELPERQRHFIKYLESDDGLLALNELKEIQASLEEKTEDGGNGKAPGKKNTGKAK